MLLKNLVIGNSVESATYAFLNGYYFLHSSGNNPLFFEPVGFKFLGSERKDYTWSRLQTFLAFHGLLLNYENISTIRIRDNEVKVVSDSGLVRYDFGMCEIFDTTGIDLENEVTKALSPVFVVYDDFELANLGGKHSYLEPKISRGSLACQIHYYTSSRVDGAHYVTDCVSVSNLTREQLSDFEYSDSMARFAVERHLTSIGIHGNFMEYYKNGSPKYRKPKVVHKKRTIRKEDMSEYKDSESVKFLTLELEGIFDDFCTTRS